MNRKFTCYASVVSEIQQSDIYLTVKARLLETPRANLNGVRVTAAFVDEIVNNSQKYVGLPLCADVKNLADGNYKHLGHLYDARTGEFHSAQIGSFYQYEKEETAEGAALIGYARIMKRNKAVCRAIGELFADGALKFSFEISCGSYRELEDGTIEIDASEDNFLEGAAVVSFPACESAVALDLVAECNDLADDTRRGEENMTDQEMEVVASTEEQTEIAEAEGAAETNETTEVAEVTEAGAESEEAVAEVVVVERHETYDTVSAYDTETGEEVRESTSHSVEVVTPVNAEAENPETVEIAETPAEEEEEEEMEEKEPEEDETASCKKDKKCAETVEQPDFASIFAEHLKMIAELKETIESLKQEIAEIKENPSHIVAEVVNAASAKNPFVGDIDMEPSKKYSLLETANSPRTYTLLDRA